MRLAALFALWIIAAGPAAAQTGDLPESSESYADDIKDFPVKLGDTYETVKRVYQTELEPIPFRGATEQGSSLRLKSRGVWFFFKRDGKIYTVRFDAPYPGAVGGVKIGDSLALLQKLRGNPIRTVPSPHPLIPRGLIYYLDDVITVRYNVNSQDLVETVFWFR